jgi:hypothetical protein
MLYGRVSVKPLTGEDEMKSYLQPEEYAYGKRGGVYGRRFVLPLAAYSTSDHRYLVTEYLVSGKANIADTYFSIPAYAIVHGKRVKGYITADDNGNMQFNAYSDKM